MQLHALNDYLDDLLAIQRYQDYCPNGLQVQGRLEIKRLITGVSACQALLEAAIAAKADAILVHHGYFWRGETATITGIHYQRIKCLLDHQLSLLAYHIPLDVHPTWGNNQQLAQRLDWIAEAYIATPPYQDLLCQGRLRQSMNPTELADHLEDRLQRTPLVIARDDKVISRIAWCTGGAGDYLQQAILAGVDAYITGEIAERHVHLAREADVVLIAAGHHATERDGVRALGTHLTEKFGIEHHFIDIANPV